MDSISSTTAAVTPGSAVAETETPHSSTAKDSLQETKNKDDEEGSGLFSLPSTEQTPLQPEHIHEAFRRLQQSPQPIKNFRGGLVRTRISLI
jgi:transcription initiation protein SPT3